MAGNVDLCHLAEVVSDVPTIELLFFCPLPPPWAHVFHIVLLMEGSHYVQSLWFLHTKYAFVNSLFIRRSSNLS